MTQLKLVLLLFITFTGCTQSRLTVEGSKKEISNDPTRSADNPDPSASATPASTITQAPQGSLGFALVGAATNSFNANVANPPNKAPLAIVKNNSLFKNVQSVQFPSTDTMEITYNGGFKNWFTKTPLPYGITSR